jgi:hypothetical protein
MFDLSFGKPFFLPGNAASYTIPRRGKGHKNHFPIVMSDATATVGE